MCPRRGWALARGQVRREDGRASEMGELVSAWRDGGGLSPSLERFWEGPPFSDRAGALASLRSASCAVRYVHGVCPAARIPAGPRCSPEGRAGRAVVTGCCAKPPAPG